MSDNSPDAAVEATHREFTGGQKIFGRYALVRILGQGGMGVVWLARDEELERDVALKFLPQAMVHDRTLLDSLKRETRRSLELTHKNIVRIYHFEQDERMACISMEYVDGETLSNLRAEKEQGVFEPNELSTWTSQLCETLDYAHNYARIIHRDLKPANLMVNRRGELKVSDFGIARSLSDTVSRLTAEQGRSGTLVYMSPQQLEGKHGTHLDDIYSLGATLYDLLTSKPPFYSGNIDRQIRERVPSSMTKRRKDLNIEPASVPAVWEQVVAACLEKDPARRPQSAMEVARRLQPTSGIPSEPTVAPAPEKSIAVLPFENLSRDPDNAYFAQGIQEEILTRLAKIADLKVISRTSTQQFQSKPANLSEIAKQLGVANILEGSVQKVADQVRVNVQLINAFTDAHLWADTFDRKLTDIFAVESEIAKTIADTLDAKLSGAEQKAIAKRPTENPEAHELYLRGRFFWNKRTGADLRRAIEYFNQALGKDPSYALAYVGLADSYGLLYYYGGTASPADSFPQAKAAAKKALALDDTLAEARTSLAFVLGDYDFDFEQSIKEFERAIQSSPNYATAHHWFSNGALLVLGQFDRAIAEGKRAVELDPLSLIINSNLGDCYFLARHYDEAIAQLRKTIEMDPRFYPARWILGEVWQSKGQLDDAIAEYRKALEVNDDPYVLALLGQAYARIGKREEAQRILARLTEEAKSRYVRAYCLALLYLALGDKERAIDEMERAYRERAGHDVTLIKVDPMLDDLRGQPRFEALVQKVLAPKKAEADSQQSLP